MDLLVRALEIEDMELQDTGYSYYAAGNSGEEIPQVTLTHIDDSASVTSDAARRRSMAKMQKGAKVKEIGWQKTPYGPDVPFAFRCCVPAESACNVSVLYPGGWRSLDRLCHAACASAEDEVPNVVQCAPTQHHQRPQAQSASTVRSPPALISGPFINGPTVVRVGWAGGARSIDPLCHLPPSIWDSEVGRCAFRS